MDLPDHVCLIRLFKADLATVTVVYRDEAGRAANYHALRHTIITNPAAGGMGWRGIARSR